MADTHTADAAPRRVLVVSADMGGGHNATASALEESVQRLWPGSECRRVDSLDVMGPGVGRLFRAIYVANVESSPWLYEFFYSRLWRQRWFARASKRFTGTWCGRRLAAEIDRFDPDMILSTYPLGSSGLAWLRRHRGLAVPSAAWISDFAPHPFWVYPELDVNFVMHEAAAPVARVAEPDATVQVCAPPVVSGFRPGDREAARERLGLPADAFVVLLSCGAYAFGDTDATVRTLLEASPQVCVLAACGRNDDTRRRLEGLGVSPDRLRPLGWTDDMASLAQASDVVLTNAGGATALEALATGVPVVMASPIAAHGKANSDLMVVSGLAEVCSTGERVAPYIRSSARDRAPLRALQYRARDHVAAHDLDEGLRQLARHGRARPLPGRGGAPRIRPWPMRPADAFFAHAEDDQVRQELGAVIEVDPVEPGRPVAVEDLRRMLQARSAGLPSMRRVLDRRGTGWLLHDRADAATHTIERRVAADATDADVARHVDDFWSAPLPAGLPAWQCLLVHGQADGRSVVAFKMHHSQGDGISALGLLDRLLDPLPGDPLTERRSASLQRTASVGVRTLGRGLWHLAARGRVPRHRLNDAAVGSGRDIVTVALPWSRLRRLAGEYDARPHEVALALVTDALDRLLRPRGLVETDRPLRAMVPVAMRAPRLDRVFGNWTGALAMDLPMGAMPLRRRVALLQREAALRAGRAEPQAAAVLMRTAGLLSGVLHRRFARAVYNRRFFNTIVSYMPGTRQPRRCAGADVRAVYPVLPLAPGVPLTVGVVVSSGVVGVGVLLDRGLGLARSAVTDAVQHAFTEALRDIGEEPVPDSAVETGGSAG